jgi:predicted DNA-binding protein with PD1-like motif
MGKTTTSIMLLLALTLAASAQTAAQPETTAGGLPVEYLSTLPPPKDGQAPAMKVTELNPNARRFQVVFSRGDEAIQGLKEFADRNNLTLAHLTAFGALQSASISWFEADKRIYKTIRLKEMMEVTSFTGSIVKNPTTGVRTVHVHGSVAIYRNGTVYAGHITDAVIGPTMQVYVDDSAPLTTTAQAPAR